MNLQNRNRLTNLEKQLMVGRENDRSKGQVGSLGWTCVIHTALFKVDNQQGPTVQHMDLYLMLCGSLDGRGVWSRMDTCICEAETLGCSPKTITLLIGYLLLLQSLSQVQLFVTPMDCSPPGSPVQGIFQARILHWVAISPSIGFS